MARCVQLLGDPNFEETILYRSENEKKMIGTFKNTRTGNFRKNPNLSVMSYKSSEFNDCSRKKKQIRFRL